MVVARPPAWSPLIRVILAHPRRAQAINLRHHPNRSPSIIMCEAANRDELSSSIVIGTVAPPCLQMPTPTSVQSCAAQSRLSLANISCLSMPTPTSPMLQHAVRN
ncbi:hypothetical protein SESBI_01345 [Sesbania bispinosa]|nr:hypothetical protein SESBI_01345 [Sesbania bispinosa]